MVSTEVVKAAQFAGAIALVAGPSFAWLVWRPAGGVDEERAPLAWVWPAASLGAVALLLFGLLDLLRFARVATEQPLAEAGWSLLLAVAGGTLYGRMILLRAGLALAVLALGRWGGPHRLREAALALLGLCALASFTLASHAAALVDRGAWPALADLTHLVAMAVWTGGLVFLAGAPWATLADVAEGRVLLRRATGRFAAVGLTAVALLALTGAYLASLRIYGPAALIETFYGSALLAKLLIVASVLAVAAVNRFLLLPAIEVRRVALWLQGLIGLEVMLAAAALTFAADLTILPTAEEAPVRVAVVATAEGLSPRTLQVPLGRPVRLTLINRTGGAVSLSIREFQHQLQQGPGAVRHREMLVYAPPADRIRLEAPPGGRAVAQFVPLEEGAFPFTNGSEGQTGVLTVQVR